MRYGRLMRLLFLALALAPVAIGCDTAKQRPDEKKITGKFCGVVPKHAAFKLLALDPAEVYVLTDRRKLQEEKTPWFFCSVGEEYGGASARVISVKLRPNFNEKDDSFDRDSLSTMPPRRRIHTSLGNGVIFPIHASVYLICNETEYYLSISYFNGSPAKKVPRDYGAVQTIATVMAKALDRAQKCGHGEPVRTAPPSASPT